MFEKILFIIIVLVISIALLFPVASKIALAAPNDTITVNVNVSSISQITILPETLTWTLVGAGTEGGHKNITIKNTGSVNVSKIQGYVDTLSGEPARPYTSSNATKYSAGGVLTIQNETEAKYFFIGRIEWNWTQDIPNHVWTVTSPKAWGYFRNTTNDYVWVLGNGTGGYCNNTATQFALEDDIDVGTAATREPTTSSISLDGNDTNWTYFSVLRTPFNSRSCVATYYDCSKIYIYAFDMRTSPDNFNKCGNSTYLYSGSGTEHPLAPGATIILKVNPWIPYGTPAGDLNTATLTIEAE